MQYTTEFRNENIFLTLCCVPVWGRGFWKEWVRIRMGPSYVVIRSCSASVCVYYAGKHARKQTDSSSCWKGENCSWGPHLVSPYTCLPSCCCWVVGKRGTQGAQGRYCVLPYTRRDSVSRNIWTGVRRQPTLLPLGGCLPPVWQHAEGAPRLRLCLRNMRLRDEVKERSFEAQSHQAQYGSEMVRLQL